MWMRRRSLLPRLYGAYSITIQNHEKYFVVMESVFCEAPKGKVHQRYDLKGSWIDRHAGMKAAHGGTFKDMDMHQPLRLPDGHADRFLDELKADTALLRDANLMDYSLLLGVHNEAVPTAGLPVQRAEASAASAGHGGDDGLIAREVDVPRYYMGLIDVLQAWDLNKRLERLAKIFLKGRFARHVRDGMSALEPTAYRERFLTGIGYQLGVDHGSQSV